MLVDLGVAKATLFRSPKAQFRARLAQFSEHEIACMTIKDFEALAFDLRSPMGGAGLFDSYEQKVLDHIFTDPAWTPATTLYVGLSSTTPTEAAGSISEPTGGAYARIATTAADWSAASGTAPAVKTHTATFTWAMATADWLVQAPLTNFVLCNSLAGVTTADFIAFGPLSTPKPILNGDTATFAAGAITMQLGDPGDTY